MAFRGLHSCISPLLVTRYFFFLREIKCVHPPHLLQNLALLPCQGRVILLSLSLSLTVAPSFEPIS
jgi:hypothetical protein